MRQRIALVFLVFLSGAVAFAHDGKEHVHGVVTAITPNSITVETAPSAAKTLTLDKKTSYKRGGKAAKVTDIKIGDSVVVDVVERTTQAVLVQIAPLPTPAPNRPR